MLLLADQNCRAAPANTKYNPRDADESILISQEKESIESGAFSLRFITVECIQLPQESSTLSTLVSARQEPSKRIQHGER